LEVFPSARGEFRSQLTLIELNRLWMQRGEERLSSIASHVGLSDRVAITFLVSDDEHPYQHDGVDVSPSEIVLDYADVARRRTFGPHRWAAMSLPHADLALAARVLADRELFAPSTWGILRPPPAHMARLQILHAKAVRLALGAPDRLTHPETVRSLEQSLIRTMVHCLDGSPVRRSAGAARHTAIVTKLEKFLKANHDRPLYLAEICAATGVSERMLEVSCKEHIGISPFRYLWLRRMHLARRALLRADPATTTVTAVSTDHGFWELGRFSVQYAKLFGESPSATLRKPPDEQRTVQNRPFDLPNTVFA
jgi:AraC-like DNA-binding protein